MKTDYHGNVTPKEHLTGKHRLNIPKIQAHNENKFIPAHKGELFNIIVFDIITQ
jgi:hypothetical protein